MLKLSQVSFSYNRTQPVLRDLDLELRPGELLAVMGPSGCGKSTLLHLIAGLLKPTAGELRSDFQQVCCVFQEPRLFPWFTVEQNIRAVLPHKASSAVIAEALELVELPDAGRLYPSELSGGMKSRASLARALAYGGDLMLLDEPFASLNEDLRQQLTRKIRERLTKTGAAAILVTHHRQDAQAFSDRLLELSPV